MGHFVRCRGEVLCELGVMTSDSTHLENSVRVVCSFNGNESVTEGVVKKAGFERLKNDGNNQENEGELYEQKDETNNDGGIHNEMDEEMMGGMMDGKETDKESGKGTEWEKVMGSDREEWTSHNKRLQFVKASLVLFANHFKVLLIDLNIFHRFERINN